MGAFESLRPPSDDRSPAFPSGHRVGPRGYGSIPAPGFARRNPLGRERSSRLDLTTPVQYLKGVGPSRAGRLAALDIETVEDLLHHYPRRHEDRSRFRSIDSLAEGETATVSGQVVDVVFRRMRGRLSLVTVTIADETGGIELAFWNQPFRRRQFSEGDELVVTGKVEWRRGLKMSGPEVEKITEQGEDAFIHTGRIVPIYGLTKGISAGVMRRMVYNALRATGELVTEYLLPELLEARALIPLPEAIEKIHFPASEDEVADAARRLKYEELFVMQCALALRRRRVKEERDGHAFRWSAEIDRRIRDRLPFELTAAQERVVGEILADMRDARPMSRLLQGDVGSGKTAVALYSILVCVANGGQAAIMAPTEILAEQHMRTFSRYLEGSRVRIEAVLGGLPAKARREILAGLEDGSVDVAVGTHALIQPDVEYRDLALVVVDEQHRFGVMQRAILERKGTRPDMLFMTATPIPRTLSLALFGDLDGSIIDELPPGRKPVRTVFFPPKGAGRAYDLIRAEVRKGRQAFFVFPLVTESEEMPLKAATEEVERLRAEVFPELSIGLIHGRMKRAEKEEAMVRFRAGDDQVLVATTVVEVGIDVPNATVMVIEHAERYGLSQLHQLRGRIGRGGDSSTLILIGEPKTPEAKRRLEVMCETQDGFKIAAEDLALRGPGEVFGTRQHGLPDLRIADLATDLALLDRAHRDAFELVRKDPALESGTGARVREILRTRFGRRLSLSRV